jgi:histidinol-phosphate aminotransferase
MTAPSGPPRPRRRPPANPLLRLDQLANPYGPSIRALEAIGSAADLHLRNPDLEELLRRRLAELDSVPAAWITFANGIDELLLSILLMTKQQGPVVDFPPTDRSISRLAALAGRDVVSTPRSHRFAAEIDPAPSSRIPNDATAIVQSPNDPTGILLAPANAVRLTRTARLVVIDERHGAYSPRSLRPMVGEFTNIVLLRSFETWAGLGGLPLAYAIAPARLSAQLAEAAIRPPAGGAVLAALATLDDLDYMNATVDRIRSEKSHLYRTLRKLNMIRPFPSWANFLMARIERGVPDHFDSQLRARGIAWRYPAAAELPGFARISAATPDATVALKNALIEIAAGL